MDRLYQELDTPDLGRPGAVIRYGHYGRPLLVFATEAGRAWDFENNGMIEAISGLIEAGRIKVYCVDSFDHVSWSNYSLPIEDRARRHTSFERWVLESVVPLIDADSPGHGGIITTGCSLGGYHAVNAGLKRPDLFPVAISLSGSFDPWNWHAWGEGGDAAYFANPMAYVPGMQGAHLDWVRSHATILLVAGQGAFEEHPTGSLPSTRAMAHVLADKGLRHELDLWGHDSAHDWPWWRRQLTHHLPRFC